MPLNDLLLNPVQAAERAGVDESTIRWWIRHGRLPAETIGTRYVIYVHDLDRYLRLREAARTLAQAAPEPTPEQAQVIRDALPPAENLGHEVDRDSGTPNRDLGGEVA